MRFRSGATEVVTSAAFYCLAAYICLVAAVHLTAGLHLLKIDHFTGPLHWGWSALAFAAMVVAYLAWFRALQPEQSPARSVGTGSSVPHNI